jgi:hypothetical protein
MNDVQRIYDLATASEKSYPSLTTVNAVTVTRDNLSSSLLLQDTFWHFGCVLYLSLLYTIKAERCLANVY